MPKVTDQQKLIIIEALRSDFDKYFMTEVGEQPPAPGAPPAAPAAAPAAPAAPAADDPTAMLGQLDDPNAAPPVDYTTEQFVEDLNKIRGGRSFDDQDVYSQIDTMFQQVDPTSKEAVKSVLQQLAPIVTPPAGTEGGDIPAQVDPSGQSMNTPPAAAAPAAPAVSAPAEAPPA